MFQSYSLMPWLSVTGNVALAVDAVHGDMSAAERAALVARYVKMVGLSHAADRRPAELSGRHAAAGGCGTRTGHGAGVAAAR